MKKINVYINGEKKLISIRSNLSDVLENFEINTNKIAIEINQKVIPKSLYRNTLIKNEDKIEIVQFIGGG